MKDHGIRSEKTMRIGSKVLHKGYGSKRQSSSPVTKAHSLKREGKT